MRKRPTRIVSIDFGLARIGMAVSDERKIIAMPLPTIKADKKLEQTAQKIAAELVAIAEKGGYDIEEIVVGLPLKMDGQIGLMADEVHQFVDMLRQSIGVPIVLWDERLTSVMAERSMRESNMTRKQRAKNVDRVAAVIILQNYLDSKSSQWT
ncbi:MAG: Holliday junction resolvase RuvX [Chlamydiales bacterium]|nr:Holliday junction resolvase RuvX [Chlamydiales bacterium]